MDASTNDNMRAAGRPGDGRRIAIEPSPDRVIVSYASKVVADTRDALLLREGDYPPVLYIPRSDVDMSMLERSEHKTSCPHKGTCAYFSITVDGRRSANAAWTYEAPFESVIAIRDHLAFYPGRVDAIETRAGEQRAGA